MQKVTELLKHCVETIFLKFIKALSSKINVLCYFSYPPLLRNSQLQEMHYNGNVIPTGYCITSLIF